MIFILEILCKLKQLRNSFKRLLWMGTTIDSRTRRVAQVLKNDTRLLFNCLTHVLPINTIPKHETLLDAS